MEDTKFLRSIIGKCVRLKRNEKGLTQEGVANIVFLSDKYLGGIERGEKLPTIETLYKLTIAVDTTLGFIFEGIEQEIILLKSDTNQE